MKFMLTQTMPVKTFTSQLGLFWITCIICIMFVCTTMLKYMLYSVYMKTHIYMYLDKIFYGFIPCHVQFQYNIHNPWHMNTIISKIGQFMNYFMKFKAFLSRVAHSKIVSWHTRVFLKHSDSNCGAVRCL